MQFLFGLRDCPHGVFGSRVETASAHGRDESLNADSARVRWTVRRDWPDGTHEFVGLESDQAAAAALWARMVVKLRRLPFRPHQSVVPISKRDFWLHGHHRPACKAPDCPTAADVVP